MRDTRHKFIPLHQVLPDGAVAVCESCGALNNAGAAGCLSLSQLVTILLIVIFIACFGALESVFSKTIFFIRWKDY